MSEDAAALGTEVLVVCKGAGRLDVLDASTLRASLQVPLSAITGHEVAVRADGMVAYVPIYGTGGVGAPDGEGDRIDVVDLTAGTITESLVLPPRSFPHAVAVLPEGSLVVTLEGRNALAVVDPGTGEVVEADLGFGQGHMLAVSQERRRAWTAHVEPGVVVEVDLEAMVATRSFRLSSRANRIAITHDATRALVADQTSPRLAVIDLASLSLERWIDLPGLGFGSATCSRGTAVVTSRERSSLILIDMATTTITHEVPVPAAPQSVVVGEHHGPVAYVACTPSDVVVAVDLRAGEVLITQGVGAGADGLALVGRRGLRSARG